MKKFYSLLLAIVTASPFSYAKTTGVGIPNMFPHMGSDGINSSIPTNSRIIGYTYLKYNGTSFVPVDSTTYSYAFGRGGQLTKEDMDDNFVNFEHSYTYQYVAGNYRNSSHRWQTFNGVGKAQKYTIESWDTIANAWKNWGRYIYYYNNDLTQLKTTDFEIWFGGQWSQHYQYKNSYNTSNNLVRVQATTMLMSLMYDANGNVLMRADSLYNFQLNKWVANEKYNFSYNNSNKLHTYTVQVAINGSWTNKDKYEHVYTGNIIDYTIVYAWNNNTWEVKGKHIFTYDGNGNKLTDEWQYWDDATSSFISASRKVWTYNVFNQPLTYYSETYEPSSGAWISANDDFLYRYYYQPFVAAGIDDAEDIVANLYPQPAQNILNIDLKGQYLHGLITVFDAQGRNVKTQNTSGTGRETLDVSAMPAGTYYLKVTGSNNQSYSARFSVIR